VSVCAVVPAAGSGSRLGLVTPKLFLSLSLRGQTVWSVLQSKLLAAVDHICVVLSPSAIAPFEAQLERPIPSWLSIVVQAYPTGMGDAVFQALPVWQYFQTMVVLWGDQVNIRSETIMRTIATQNAWRNGCTIPVVRRRQPYVQYDITEEGFLFRIRQSREGDKLDAHGLSDVGCFALHTQELSPLWKEFVEIHDIGCVTMERNFLPFLVFLGTRGWPVRIIPASSAVESRGINTTADLQFAKRYLTRSERMSSRL